MANRALVPASQPSSSTCPPSAPQDQRVDNFWTVRRHLSQLASAGDSVAAYAQSQLEHSGAGLYWRDLDTRFAAFAEFCADRGIQSLPANPLSVVLYTGSLELRYRTTQRGVHPNTPTTSSPSTRP